MKKGFFLGVFITLIVVSSLLGAYYLGMQSKNAKEKVNNSLQQPTITNVEKPETPMPTIKNEESKIPEGWLTYRNEEYGFEISYPSNYKALTDKENLYGWPNAIVLIYGGGQSYDLPIEVWNTEAEYKSKYSNAKNLYVMEVRNKYLTLVNVNFEPEVEEIIKTFKIVQ